MDGFPSRLFLLRFVIRWRNHQHTHSNFMSYFQQQLVRLSTWPHPEHEQVITQINASYFILKLSDKLLIQSIVLFLKSQPIVKLPMWPALGKRVMAKKGHEPVKTHKISSEGNKTMPWPGRWHGLKPRTSQVPNSAYLSVLFAWMSYFTSGHAVWQFPILWVIQMYQVSAVRMTYIFSLWKRKHMRFPVRCIRVSLHPTDRGKCQALPQCQHLAWGNKNVLLKGPFVHNSILSHLNPDCLGLLWNPNIIKSKQRQDIRRLFFFSQFSNRDKIHTTQKSPF